MTEICIRTRPGRYTLQARGHATGSAEVCAGLSALLCALAGYAGQAGGKVHARELAPGLAVIDVSGGRRVEGAFRMTAAGLVQMGRQYPRFLRVEILEE